MRTIVCDTFGPPDTLRLVDDAPEPEAGPGQVVVDVAACGLNFVDALMCSGGYQIKPPLPFVPGGEIAGTIRAIGPDVEGWSVGDRVLSLCGLGGCTERIALSPLGLIRVPDELDLPRAASLVQAYATNLFAYRRAHLQAGETVLVLGAGGGIGLAAVDLARALGATTIVAAASSAEKLALAEQAGATHLIDYSTDDLKATVRSLVGSVDVVVDPVGGPVADPALRTLGFDGRYLVIGFASGTIPTLAINQVLLNNRSLIGVEWGGYAFKHPRENRALISDILEMAADGRIRPVAPAEVPLDEVPDAFARFLARGIAGKVVAVP